MKDSILHLEPVTIDSPHLEEVVSWLNDKEHIRFSNQKFKSHTIESQIEYCKSMIAENHRYYLAFSGNQLVGTATILNRNPHKTAEIGILISNKLFGMGFGRELLKTVSDLALGTFEFDKLRAGCLSINKPMIRILESCDFHKEATLLREEIHFGVRQDLVFYSKHKNFRAISS